LSIARTTSDSARVAGALAGAGVFALFGMGPAYAIIACFYVAGALLTLGIANPRRRVSLAMTPDDPQSSPWRDLKAGLSQVWNTPMLLAIVWLAFLANLTAFPLTNGLMPYVVKDVFVLEQPWLGYLVASFAGGALAGSIVLSHAGANVALPRMMIVATLLWYALLLAFANMPGPLSAIVCLLVAGFMQSFCMVPLSIMLLRAAGERFRGRVMGVRMMAMGPLIDWMGFRATASLYAIIGIVCTALIAMRWRAELWRA
jgi:Na+/melibiose symporter-like transporter